MAQIFFFLWMLLLGLNALSFTQFGWDKRCAEQGMRRISEDALLTTAMLGGWIGAYLGRSYFRHKTRKQPFGTRLLGVSILNAVAVSGAAFWFVVAP